MNIVKKQQEQSNKSSQKIIDSTLSEDMVRNNIGWMIAVALRLLTDRALAEDAVQEAFVAAFRNYDKFEKRSSLKTWLHRITVNAALVKLRKIKRLNEQTIDDLLPEFDQYECRIETLRGNITSIEDIVDSEQNRTQVRPHSHQ